jgi:hypothetical protein
VERGRISVTPLPDRTVGQDLLDALKHVLPQVETELLASLA